MGEQRDPAFYVDIQVYVVTGIAAGADGVWDAGPAMLLQVCASKLSDFGRDLRSETELALHL